MKSRLFLIAGLSALIAACASPRTDIDVEAAKRSKAWKQLDVRTEATSVGMNRLRITASTPLTGQISTLEQDLLARAAGEAVRRNSPRFAIVFLEYDDTTMSDWFMVPQYAEPATGWIGNYEDLLEARYENDPDGSLKGNFGYRNMTAVVRLLAEGEETHREAFNSEDLYRSLIAEYIDRKNIKAPKKWGLPKLRFRSE